jgi:hypothetical protein
MMTRAINQSKTAEDLLEFFQQYATELLRRQNQEIGEALRRRNIDTGTIQPLEKAYSISFKLSNIISLESIKAQILQQIDATVYFVRDIYIGVLGQRNTLFPLYDVEIIIDKNIKKRFQWESGKLFLYISYINLKLFKSHFSYQTLKDLWSRGEHLDKASPIYKSWWLFNPLGEFCSNLRLMLLLAIERQILGIDRLLIELGIIDIGKEQHLVNQDDSIESNTNRFKAETKLLSVHQSILTFLKISIKEDKLEVKLEDVLKEQDEETLIRLLNLFKKNLADPIQIQAIINTSLLILKQVIHEEQSQIDIKMFGFVNVGNYHRIDVSLNLSSSALKNYIEVIPRTIGIKVILYGLVNVYTIDDITVKPNFQGALKLDFETATLERTLKELQL